MEIQDILSLVKAVADHSLTELKLDDGNIKLTLKREEKPAVVVSTASQPAAPVILPAVVPAVSAAAAPEAPAQEAHPSIDSDKVVTSPLVGTFYSAPSPDADEFVKVGDTVKKGQVLGIIEAMKLMNEIESEYDGIVEAILVNNEDVVEFGQPLFRIR